MTTADRLFRLIICVIAGITFSEASSHWSYTGHTGVSFWKNLFPEACSGRHQSPIDIRPEETTYNSDLKSFAIWYDPPKPGSKMYIKNNGHTVQIDLEGDFFVTNGGLSHVYKGLQFHYHWGSDSSVNHGSEHLVDGEAFPLEMHLVTYNSELYSTIGEAVTAPGGLAVLGTMFEISEEDNPLMTTIVKALKNVRDPELHEKVDLPLMSLRDLLPADISRYYRYNGSLTTPGCFESVIWTVFDDRQKISLSQLREFKKLLQKKHKVHKEKISDGHEVSRHRRSVGHSKQRMKLAIQDVLDELGIRGDRFQEAIFHFELMQMKNGKHHNDDPNFRRKREVNEDVAEEDGASQEVTTEGHHQAEDELVDNNNDNDTADVEDHGGEHHDSYKVEEKVEETEVLETDVVKTEVLETDVVETEVVEDVYTQETMVDNYRPVQPLNDRVVYRSFRLRERKMDRLSEIRTGQLNSGNDDDDINGSTYHKLSLPAILTILTVAAAFV